MQPREVLFSAVVVDGGGVAGVDPCGLEARVCYGGDGGFEAFALGEGEGGSDDLGCGEVRHDAVEREAGLSLQPVE